MMNNRLFPIAHAHRDIGKPHSLADHALQTGSLAAFLAEVFGGASLARLAGHWHDLGKFSTDFQNYIRKASGFEEGLVSKSPARVDHSSAGALYAYRQQDTITPHAALALAYVIAGHHAGLPDWLDGLEGRLKKAVPFLDALDLNAIPQDLLVSFRPEIPSLDKNNFHQWVRMLFSCLVDADYRDTEQYFEPERTDIRDAEKFSPIRMLDCFNRYMHSKKALADSTAQGGQVELNRYRENVLSQCRFCAGKAPGIFSLTVPTGGGKTLSSLAFALEHAVAHEKRRVIYAIPYTSIIEQTADVFRDVFAALSPDVVLEHHSNFDFDTFYSADSQDEKTESDDFRTDTRRQASRMATENWDAPLVVTTNVQFFESLFSNRPSRCRKLHNIANSVVILDEVQLLPPDFLQPIINAMKVLVSSYGVTFVLCSATQPALGSRTSGRRTRLSGLDNVREIIDDVPVLYQVLDRVRFVFPKPDEPRMSWEALAKELAEHDQVMAIVNTRASCAKLYALMPPGTIHLSARMCAEHRSHVIACIRKKLAAGETARVVSTQLIEAGVDISFPVIYRAMAGLDSIMQAGGRCNRENRMVGKGMVKVFFPPQIAPPGLLRFGEQATRLMLEKLPEALMPEDFTHYFDIYYGQVDTGSGKNGFDRHGIGEQLESGSRPNFKKAAEFFRLIDSGDTVSVIVPYKRPDGRDPSGDIARLKNGDIAGGVARRLQRFTVNLYRNEAMVLWSREYIVEALPGFFVLVNPYLYDETVGFRFDEAALTAEETVWS